MPFDTLLASAFLLLLCFVLLLNIFGLPANWFILALVALWQFFHPAAGNMGWLFWIGMLALAIAGEVLETALQLLKARKYGSTSSGTLGGMIGAIAGAIVLAPFFFGLGAFLGALGGAWLGCFVMEQFKGRSPSEAYQAAWGTMVGRFLGTVGKIGIGAVLIVLTWHHIWPDEPEVLPSQNAPVVHDR